MFFCLLTNAATREGGWLAWRPLVTLGSISYSVYLIHLPIVAAFSRIILPLDLPALTKLALCEGIGAPIIVALGWLFFRSVEAPFLRGRQAVIRHALGPVSPSCVRA